MSTAPLPTPEELDGALVRWRARGVASRDPVRFQLVESLARRAAAQPAATRAWVDARLQHWLAVCAPDWESDGMPPAAQAPSPPRPAMQALAGLRQALQSRQAAVAEDVPALPGPMGGVSSLQDVRRTWARLDAERRLHDSLARVPAQAGPLNSVQLVLRALTLMHQVSPAYLQHFTAHVDALRWLDAVDPPAPPRPGRR
ncbi:MAG: DUF2894 domain-containing protein [Burkholderiales bacterium]|nr:DUF2894 domain-containing protein [Burkholderiales bacterium]